MIVILFGQFYTMIKFVIFFNKIYTKKRILIFIKYFYILTYIAIFIPNFFFQIIINILIIISSKSKIFEYFICIIFFLFGVEMYIVFYHYINLMKGSKRIICFYTYFFLIFCNIFIYFPIDMIFGFFGIIYKIYTKEFNFEYFNKLSAPLTFIFIDFKKIKNSIFIY